MEGSSSHTHSLGHLHSQAEEIIYNVTRYFIAENVKKGTLIHWITQLHMRFGIAVNSVMPFLASQQL